MYWFIDTLTSAKDTEEPIAEEALVPVHTAVIQIHFLRFLFFFLQNFVRQQYLELPGPPDTGLFSRILVVCVSM